MGGLGDALAAELHPAIHEPFASDEFVFQGKPEVPVASGSGEKFVPGISSRRAPRDRAVHDPPGGPAFPAREGFSIKNGLGRCRKGSGNS